MSETATTLMLAFAGVVSVCMVFWILVSWYLSRRSAEMDRRVRPADDSDPTLQLHDMVDRGGVVGSWVRFYRSAQEWMERTGLGLDVMEAAAIVLFCGVVLAAIVFFWRFDEEEVWMAFPAFALGVAIPSIFFIFRQGVWRRRIQDQLPDTLFLLARTLRAGMSIDQSIQMIGEHGTPPLSREFGRMHRQLDLGLSLNQVLQVTAQRLGLVDFRVFSSVLSLHRTTGGNLPIIVDRLAHTTRERNQLRAYYRTSTSLGRFGTAIILVIVGIGMFDLAFNHRDLAAHYFQTTEGQILFGAGIGLMVVGLFLLYFLQREEE